MRWSPMKIFRRRSARSRPALHPRYRPGLELLESREVPTTLPSGFTETLVSGGLSNPTAMEFAPDGRLFVAEQGGQLRVIKDGQLLATPFLNLNVDPSGERGLLGVTFDPNFAANRFVYVYYTTATAPIHNRVSRFTANGDVAVPGSEVVLLDLENLTGATNHNGGAIHFGPDGTLFVAVGENATPSNSQTLDNRLGKILRLNADGSIPSDNPFFNTAVGPNRSIWALGLRNPFTFAFQPGTGRLFINDVGAGAFEEINEGVAAANYGWPNTEGPTNDPRFRSPLFAYPHQGPEPIGCAITGGAFYNPIAAQFPSPYVGDYFFSDLCGQWVYTFDPVSGAVTEFATDLPGLPVDLKVDAAGSLYYLVRGSTSAVYRVDFPAGQVPVILQHPVSQTVLVGAPATFSVQAVGAAPLSYQWQRNGVDIAGATSPSYTLALVAAEDDGSRFRVVVSNARGTAVSNEAALTARIEPQNPQSDNFRFVTSLYDDLLDRAADATGRAVFLRTLEQARLAVLGAVASDFVSSTERRAQLIGGFYTSFLGRSAAPGEVNQWLGAVAQGATLEQVLAIIAGSAESFQSQGSSNSRWLDLAYQQLLGRGRDAGSGGFLDALTRGVPRTQVVGIILGSDEFLLRKVRTTYSTYLGRQPAAAEAAGWLPLLREPAPGAGRPSPGERFLAALLGSEEYLGRKNHTNTVWIASLYTDLLGRSASPGELSATLGRVLGGYGVQRQEVAALIVGSLEFQSKLVAESYQRFLGRVGSSAERAPWVAVLQGGGRNEQVLAGILGSAEYFQNQGATNSGWLDQVYTDLLGRARDAGSQVFLDALNNRTLTRSQVAAAILGSDEYRQVVVRTIYQDFLQRQPSAAEINFWVPPLRQGTTEAQLRAAVLASQEYSQRQTGSP
jgi:glucose/arabinose dehydrogenase